MSRIKLKHVSFTAKYLYVACIALTPYISLMCLIYIYVYIPLLDPGVLNCEESRGLRGVDRPLTSKTGIGDVSLVKDLRGNKKTNKTKNTVNFYFSSHIFIWPCNWIIKCLWNQLLSMRQTPHLKHSFSIKHADLFWQLNFLQLLCIYV